MVMINDRRRMRYLLIDVKDAEMEVRNQTWRKSSKNATIFGQVMTEENQHVY